MEQLLQPNYREVLNACYVRRLNRNPQYSLRAFARDIQISPPRLSHILNGKHGLSKEAAKLIAANLGLSKTESEMFCELVEAEHARSKMKRRNAVKRIRSLKHFSVMSDKDLSLLSEWYYLATLTYLQNNPEADFLTLAADLDIQVTQAKDACRKLQKLQMLEGRDGQWKTKGQLMANADHTPSQTVRNFHRQILEKSLAALENLSVNKRHSLTLMTTVDSADIPRAKEKLGQFLEEFDREFSKKGKNHEVYSLTMQFFGLQKIKTIDKESR